MASSGQGRGVSHVESKALLQLAAGVGRERVGPRRLDDGGRVAELEREAPALGRVPGRERGIDQPDRGDTAERERAGEAPFEGHGLDVFDRSQGAGEITNLELGERLLGADVRRPAVADGRSRGGVRGRRSAPPERVERRGSEEESLGMIGSVREQGLDEVERVDERAEPQCLSGSDQQPLDGCVGTPPIEPVPRDQRRRRAGTLESACCVTVYGDALMGREPIGQRLTHEFVPEPVAPIAHHDHARVQRRVEQREGILLRRARESRDLRRVEISIDEREATEHRRMGFGEVDEPGERNVSRPQGHRLVAADSAGQFDEEQGVPGRKLDDRVDHRRLRGFRRSRDDQRRGVVVRERPDIERQHTAGAGQGPDTAVERLGRSLGAVREHHEHRRHGRRRELQQHVDRRFVSKIGVIDEQDDSRRCRRRGRAGAAPRRSPDAGSMTGRCPRLARRATRAPPAPFASCDPT